MYRLPQLYKYINVYLNLFVSFSERCYRLTICKALIISNEAVQNEKVTDTTNRYIKF